MTPEEIDALPDYTPAQMVRYIDSIIVSGSAGTSYTIRGKTYTHPPLEALQKMRGYYDGLAAQDSNGNAGPFDSVALTRFGNSR